MLQAINQSENVPRGSQITLQNADVYLLYETKWLAETDILIGVFTSEKLVHQVKSILENHNDSPELYIVTKGLNQWHRANPSLN